MTEKNQTNARIRYEMEDGAFFMLRIDDNDFEIESFDENKFEVFVPHKYLTDFPVIELITELTIKVCDDIEEIENEYKDEYGKKVKMTTPTIKYSGTSYNLSKLSDDKILISFEEMGRRKLWDGEIGYKYYMEAKKKAIEERAETIRDIRLDNYDDDGDYIIMNFSTEFKTENLSKAIAFSEKFLNQIENATSFKLKTKYRIIDFDTDDLLSSEEQELNLELMLMAIENGKKSISEEGKLSPKVGASIIKDGKVLGVAFRGQEGEGDHAEFTLFEKVLKGQDVSGATLFTTLEPCTHRNKHKPCSEWIIEKGIKHVYIGLLDPNPKIYNNGCKKLKAAGIEVSYFPRDLRTEIAKDNTKFIEQYNANPNLQGTASFNYSNNNGLFIIGNNEMIFETKWSKASNTSIHAYNDPGTIKTIAIAAGNNEINEIKDGSIYNTSSRSRSILNGQILIIENISGYFAAIKILDIKDDTRGDGRDELTFEFRILEDKTADFTK